MGCQMIIKLRTSKDGTKLVVKDSMNVHNHVINKVVFVQKRCSEVHIANQKRKEIYISDFA